MRILKKGKNNTKRLPYTVLVRPILEYGAVCWGSYKEDQVSALNRAHKRAAKFSDNMSRVGKLWHSECAIFKAYTGGRAWKVIGDRLLKPCYLSRDNHNQKINTSKKKERRRDVGKYSFVNRTIKSWTQLPAGLLASFPRKLNTFRKKVKNVVTGKGIQMGIGCK